MDVSNLIPSPAAPNTAPGASPRARPEAAPLSNPVAAPAPAGATTARPTAPANPSAAVSDRIERSPELTKRVAELELELGRQTEAAREHVAEVSQRIREAMDASHETLLRAALGIIHGELYFLPS